MQPAPIPENEAPRLESLHQLAILDTKPEQRFDRITRMATQVLKVPISTLTLVDATREWFKSCQGLPEREGERAISFCGHAVAAKEIFVVLDATKDKRFADNPMVIGKPFIRFYAGTPLLSADGQRVGVFCVKDTRPHGEFSKDEQENLKSLALWAELELNSRNLSLALSERKQAEKKLLVSESLYRSLFDNILDGMAYCQMIFDERQRPVDFRYLEVNPNFEKLTGLKAVIGKKVTEAIPGVRKSNPELFEIYGRVSLTARPERFETYVEQLRIWFLISAYSPKNGYFVAIFQNITGRKQAEKDVLDAKARLEQEKAKDEAILESIGDGLFVVDINRNIIMLNSRAETMLGLSKNKAIGMAYDEAWSIEDKHGKELPLEQRPIQIALSGKSITTTTTTNNNYYYVKKGKTKFPVAISVAPVRLEGKIAGVVGVFRDITKQKEIDRAKTEFVSLASHQLRTPITAISWYAKMLLSQEVGKLNAGQKKYVLNISYSNKRMIELVDALLNVSRIDLGTFSIQSEMVDLPETCKNIISELRTQIQAKQIGLTENYQADLPKISADNKLVYIIFQNLLANAISYTPEGGKVAVDISLKNQGNGSHYLITVADTGIGIPAAQTGQIFTKMFRADNAKALVTDGTGLGLYIVKSILTHTGGGIKFESRENQGTTFSVTLPAAGMKQREGDKRLL